MKTSKIYLNTVSPLLLEVFNQLSEIPLLQHCRLVGGTALSLLLGHRISVDIDLFTDQEYGTLDFDALEKALSDKFAFFQNSLVKIAAFGKSYYVGNSPNESIKIDIYYTDPFVSEGIYIGKGLPIASLEDIIPLKVEAVMNRGSKKDFWDLHEILEHYSLSTIISLYENKYPYISFNSEMLAQFIHFEEADNDNDPICLKGKHWELIKLDIEEAVIKEN